MEYWQQIAKLHIVPKRNIFFRQENSFWKAEGKWIRFTLLIILLGVISYLITSVKPWKVGQGDSLQVNPSDNYVIIGTWWGFLISSIICSTLLLTWRRWSFSTFKINNSIDFTFKKTPSYYYWIILLLIVFLGAFLRWNLINSSLSWEEFEILGGDSEKIDSYNSVTSSDDWSSVLWDYPSPDKSPLLKAMVKLSHGTWSSMGEFTDPIFSEFAIRLPNFLASLASIFVIGILMKNWGFKNGGILASFLLAMHPWHIENGSLVTTDGILIFLIILTALFLTKSINDTSGRWRYWIIFSFTQLMISWLIPDGLIYAVGFFICGYILIKNKEDNISNRSFFLSRIFISHAISLMIFFPLYSPNIMQLNEWRIIPDYGIETFGNWIDSISMTIFGLPFNSIGEIIEPPIISNSLSNQFVIYPFITSTVILISIAAIAIGFMKTWLHREGAAKILIFTILLGALSILLSSTVTQSHHNNRFVSIMIIPSTILMSIGMIGTLKLIKNRRWVNVLIFLICISLCQSLNGNQRKLTLNRPHSTQKEIESYLKRRQDSGEVINILSYGFGGKLMKLYFPESSIINTSDELKAKIAEASTDNKKLLILFGYRYLNSTGEENTEAITILESSENFHKSREFNGLDPFSKYEVFRLINTKFK